MGMLPDIFEPTEQIPGLLVDVLKSEPTKEVEPPKEKPKRGLSVIDPVTRASKREELRRKYQQKL